MRPRQALRALLLLPIFVCPAPLALAWLVQDPTSNSAIENGFRNAVFLAALPSMASIQRCGIPYVLLAVGLFFWSRKKSGPRIIRIYCFAPFGLAALAAVQVFVVARIESALGLNPYSLSRIPWFVRDDAIFTAVVSFVFGYLLILLGIGGFKLMWFLGFFPPETPLRIDEIEEW
jgi:hypothetical protein